jgi:Rrf2 family transcriptional regulator, cysteine metabolism repressor
MFFNFFITIFHYCPALLELARGMRYDNHMIRISTKTRYALRALLEMACTKDKKLFQLRELSYHQKISRKYLEAIFHTLKRHKIVHSKVGKNGGFYLPADLKSISILRVLEALEGKIDVVNCQKHWRNCERILFCPSRNIWQELSASMRKLLAAQNLKEMSEKKEIREKCSYVLLKFQKKGTKPL